MCSVCRYRSISVGVLVATYARFFKQQQESAVGLMSSHRSCEDGVFMTSATARSM